MFKDLVDCALDVIIPTLGETITYKPKNGPALKIPAIFDRKWSHIDPETEQVVSSNEPRIGIKVSSLQGSIARQGDEVKIEKENFIVIDTREDGQGGIQLYLRKVGK